MNNGTCYRLNPMLHLDTQKIKQDMKMSIYKKYIGGIVAYMKKLTLDTKGCGQLTWVWPTDIKLHLLLLYLVQWSENV